MEELPFSPCTAPKTTEKDLHDGCPSLYVQCMLGGALTYSLFIRTNRVMYTVVMLVTIAGASHLLYVP